jgi:hypothetical protein
MIEHADTLRCRAGSRAKSTARRQGTDIDQGMRNVAPVLAVVAGDPEQQTPEALAAFQVAGSIAGRGPRSPTSAQYPATQIAETSGLQQPWRPTLCEPPDSRPIARRSPPPDLAKKPAKSGPFAPIRQFSATTQSRPWGNFLVAYEGPANWIGTVDDVEIVARHGALHHLSAPKRGEGASVPFQLDRGRHRLHGAAPVTLLVEGVSSPPSGRLV